MDRLKCLEVFVRVAETGNFSTVGRERAVGQSTISRDIAQLEQWLGVQLLRRTTRQVRLTDAGAELYERCTGLLGALQDMESSISSLTSKPTGMLRVHAPTEFGRLHVIPHVMDFLNDYPQIEVDLNLNDRYVDMIEEGVDIAIRIGNLADQSTIARHLGRDTRHLVAAPSYLEQYGVPQTPQDLRNHSCIIYAYRQVPALWEFDGPRGKIAVTVSGRLRANSGEAMRAAVLKGHGIAVLGGYAVSADLEAGRMRRLLEEFPLRALDIQIVYAPTRHLPRRARVFIEFYARRLEQSGLFR